MKLVYRYYHVGIPVVKNEGKVGIFAGHGFPGAFLTFSRKCRKLNHQRRIIMVSKASIVIYREIVVLAPVLTAALLLWLFSLEGTLGLYRWTPDYPRIFWSIGCLGIAGPVFAVIGGVLGARVPIASRIAFVASVFLSSAGIILAIGLFLYIFPGAARISPSTPPVLLIANKTGSGGVSDLALVFRTAAPTKNVVAYGPEFPSTRVGEGNLSRDHAIPLKNLSPGTRYRWTLNDGPEHSFLTPGISASGTPGEKGLAPLSGGFRFAVGSDPHFGAAESSIDHTASILRWVSDPARGFNAFFLLGDSVDRGMVDSQWQSLLGALSPASWSVPVRPIPGNHDTIIDGMVHYLAYLYPKVMETRGSRLWYRIDAGNVHVLTLEMLWGTEDFSAAQRSWLESELSSIPPGDWKLVMMHCMAYSSGYSDGGVPWFDHRDMIRELSPILEKYGVDAAFSGHDHDMELLRKNGVTYIVIGTLGGIPDPVRTYSSPASVWYLDGVHGFLDVGVIGGRMDLTFRDHAGTALESFSIDKNQ
jgi:hypothetical protein